MSATSHDAFSRQPGQPLSFGAAADDVAEHTEDIADEITSELAESGAVGAAMPVPDVMADAAGSEAREQDPAPGPASVLRDRYVLEALLGSGGTSVVYRAFDLRRDATGAGGQEVAVKLLRPERRGEPRAIARLQREFRQTLAAAHPYVLRFHDLDCDRGSWFIVMELLSGETLAARLRQAAPGGLPAGEARVIAAAVAEALEHAHARRVVHGDVKPANVFMTGEGGVRVLDFGAAPEPGDLPGPVTGTRVYASPEVLGGSRPEAGDDVFSLACMACELFGGTHPYGRRGADVAIRANVTPERPPGIEDALWRVLRKALDPCRASRPRMGELAAALRGVDVSAVSGQAVAEPAVDAALQPPALRANVSATRPRFATSGAIAAGLMLLLGILVGRLARDESPPAPSGVPEGTAEAVAAQPLPPAAEIIPRAAVNPAPAAPQSEQPAASAAATPPPTTGVVTFGEPAMVVSNRAVVAAIPLRHLSSAPRDAGVRWRIIEGSALPGRDYGGPESGVESFAAGNSFRILYVPIVANPASTRDRTFVVELTGATPGVEIGDKPRIAVTILGDG